LVRAASRLLLGGLCLAALACRTAAPPARISRVPDPLVPAAPGAPMSADQQAALRRAVAAAESGEFLRAERELATLPRVHPAVRLAAMEVVFLQNGNTAAAVKELTSEYPAYPSAWGVLALAWHREGDVRQAVGAARKAAELGLPGDWTDTAARWEKAFTDTRLAEGSAMLQRGDAAGALRVASEILELMPTATAARILATRAHLAMGDAKAAAMLVPALPDTEDGIELKGQVAERLGQWDLAVDLYGRLPSSNPRRCDLLRTARDQWRLVNAPPYLTRALGAKVLTRKGLAAIVVWKAPELASQATGPASVFEDIVNLNERRDIITVVRSGVMAGDPVTRSFGAEHSVTPRELQAVLGRLAAALGRRPLTWCEEDDGKVCVTVPTLVDGATAAALTDDLVGGEDTPCRPR
jgi:tetratricopeptide (TPR) repeat protein